MRIFVWITVVIIGFNMLIYGDVAINNLDTQKMRYKRALDSATYAAARYRYYNTEEYVENISDGQNENIKINKEQAIKWFYKIFFRNIGVEEESFIGEELKTYIILKALISYDALYIADSKENWTKVNYDIEYKGKIYRFTLKDRIHDIDSGAFRSIAEIGLTSEKRKELVTNHIKEQINNFLNLREQEKNSGNYYVDFGLSDIDKNTELNGINFVAFVEGMPIPAFNLNQKNKLYAVSFSGAEVRRR